MDWSKNSFLNGTPMPTSMTRLTQNVIDNVLLSDDERRKKALEEQRKNPAVSMLFGSQLLGDAASELFPRGRGLMNGGI